MNRFHVGGRVFKTALAVTLAIFLAQQFGLERVTLAAIIALLTVQRTFFHSLVQSLVKLGSVLIGGVLGTAFSYLFGITPLGYGLVTLTAIFICLQLRWQDHIVLTTITAITVIFNGAANPQAFSLEQIFTALLGAICALAINYLFTPNHKQEVVTRLKRAEAGINRVIDFIINEMLEPGCEDAAFQEEVIRLKKEIEAGLDTAKLLREEQRFIINRETPSDRYRQTFHIYNSQLDRLEEMHQLARRMPVKVPQAITLVKLFRIVQKVQYHRVTGKRNNYERIDQLMERLEQSFAATELPRSRQEFVSRASLFHLFQEIKRYYRRIQKMPVVVLPVNEPLTRKENPNSTLIRQG